MDNASTLTKHPPKASCITQQVNNLSQTMAEATVEQEGCRAPCASPHRLPNRNDRKAEGVETRRKLQRAGE